MSKLGELRKAYEAQKTALNQMLDVPYSLLGNTTNESMEYERARRAYLRLLTDMTVLELLNVAEAPDPEPPEPSDTDLDRYLDMKLVKNAWRTRRVLLAPLVKEADDE